MNFKSYLLFSLRYIKADKTNTFISITGLILGLGIFASILAFIVNELGYNNSFANTDRIYRVLNYDSNNNRVWANTPYIIGETVKNRFSEVEAYTHQLRIGNVEVEKNAEYISEPGMLSTSRDFFHIFGVEILQGNLDNFDEDDGKVLLSQQIAKKYFGNENPVGQLLKIRYNGNETSMEVTGVYKDFSQNSSIKALFIANINYGIKCLETSIISTKEQVDKAYFIQSWQGTSFTNFLLLKEDADVDAFESKLQDLGKENSSETNILSLSIQAFDDIYFDSGEIIDNNRMDEGDLSMLFILGFIGILILIIAFINYVNLTSAKTISKAKSFAVQKVCGAHQSSIISQMMFESVLVSLLALPFAILAAKISLPFLSEMLGKNYSVEMESQWLLNLTILVLVSIITGALTGGLVSLGTSRLGFVNILKGDEIGKGGKFYIRKAMIVFQFFVFIVLFSIMFLVQKQVRYAFHKDLGFIKEGLISIPLGDHNLELFKQEVSKNPDVIRVSSAMWMPPSNNKMYMSMPKVDKPNEQAKVYALFVDYDFAKTMGMDLKMGDDFDKEKNNSGVLVNESAVSALGLTDVIGEKTAFGTVVGVVRDFNMFSLHENIAPMVIGLNPTMCRVIAVRVRTDNIPATIDHLEKVWDDTGGTSPFSFSFTDDLLQRMYESEIRFSKTIGLLAIIAILIASLGLFGLSLLMVKQRTKEIAIRKVNGARVFEILKMLNMDFLKWVFIAFIVAVPVAYYTMFKWLERFAYKTELSWWIFALSGMVALGITLLTVSWQSWKVASRNPVESLRYE